MPIRRSIVPPRVAKTGFPDIAFTGYRSGFFGYDVARFVSPGMQVVTGHYVRPPGRFLCAEIYYYTRPQLIDMVTDRISRRLNYFHIQEVINNWP